MPNVDVAQHAFVSISVMPVDVHFDPSSGEVEYAEAPERQQDHSPEQVCQLCWVPLDTFSAKSPCTGPKVPDDISSL